MYCQEPKARVDREETVTALLNKYGYSDAESILNEWNYMKSWTDDFIHSVKTIHSMKGAAFMMACISVAQGADIDMLMYYDTRPSCYNGVFDFYTCEPLKGYYPLYWYGMFYDMDKEIKAENSIENIYSLCGVDTNGKVLSVITYYSDNDNAENKTVSVDFGKKGEYEIYLLDDEHNGELIKTTNELKFDLKIQSAVLIKEK